MTPDTVNATAKLTQAQILVAIADRAEVFRGTDGDTAYATVDVNDHKETWPVRSKGFRRWLVRGFYAIEHKPPGAQALSDALGALEARGQYDGQVHDVHVRLAGAGDAIYLDLANVAWEAVEVTAASWRVIAEPPVKFRRAKGMLPLPHPRSSSRQQLRHRHAEGLRDLLQPAERWIMPAHLKTREIGAAHADFLGEGFLRQLSSLSERLQSHAESPWGHCYPTGITMSRALLKLSRREILLASGRT